MRRETRALTAAALILLALPAIVAAQNGKSSTQQGSAPNGKPFQALQAQIDALDARLMTAEESIETLDARWREAEARLDEQGGSLQALIDADRALQDLISALEDAGDEFRGDLEALALELSQKQAAIIESCAPGSSIQQVKADGTVACEVDDASAGGAAPLVLNDFDTGLLLVGPGGSLSRRILCPSAYRAVSGGYIKGVAGHVMVDVPDANGWRVALMNPTLDSTFLRVFVRCAVP